MAGTDPDGVFEGRLKKLRNNETDKHEEEDEDESPAADLSVQARVDSVALAKGRLSSGAGSSGDKDRLEGDKDRKTLPPTGAKSRLGSAEKDKKEAGGFKGVTRKLRSSLGFGEKDKAETESKGPPDLSTHVSFNERVETVPTPGETH